MARTNQYDPKTSEARSSWLSGLAEACNKLSGVLDMKTATFTDIVMPELFISEQDRYRIYQIGSGTKLWLEEPAPVIKKNGVQINPASAGFEIDYLGGSIAFQDSKRLTSTDVITASATYIIDSSNKISNILTELEELSEAIGNDKGYYATYADLIAANPTGTAGDYALVGAEKSFYLWDAATSAWVSAQADVDLSTYYNKTQVDTLLGSKQNTINAQGTTNESDWFYYGGRNTWQDLRTKVLGAVLTNISFTSTDKITATDTILSAFGKLQAQISANLHPIKGSGAPTTSTVGVVGQDYINTSNGDKYHLVRIETTGSGDAATTSYIWEQYADKSDTPTDVITLSGGGTMVKPAGLGAGPFTITLTEEEDGSGSGGDIDIPEIIVEQTVNATSANPVSSKAVYEYVQNNKTTIDLVLSKTSTNAIANKTVLKAMQGTNSSYGAVNVNLLNTSSFSFSSSTLAIDSYHSNLYLRRVSDISFALYDEDFPLVTTSANASKSPHMNKIEGILVFNITDSISQTLSASYPQDFWVASFTNCNYVSEYDLVNVAQSTNGKALTCWINPNGLQQWGTACVVDAQSHKQYNGIAYVVGSSGGTGYQLDFHIKLFGNGDDSQQIATNNGYIVFAF